MGSLMLGLLSFILFTVWKLLNQLQILQTMF
jgi:hypothetical protein